jgi:cob(I)alamin adenosyltransferase
MVSQLETQATDSNRQLPYTVGGLVQVFTSPYRSFFTNVMAQALRIAGQGMPVLVVQFLKGGISQGHQNPVRLGQNLDWLRCDLPRCIDTPEIEDIEIAALLDLWRYTQRVVAEGRYSLVVLDELSLAINLGLIAEAEVLTFLEKRPPQVDVILTGPEVPEAIRNAADQITELRRGDRP